MDFSGISKQNAHSGRNVMPRCLSEGVDIFLKSVERQGESGHDVRVSRSAPWMARVGDPVMMRTTVSLFIRKFTPGDATSRRDVPFAAGVRGVYGNPTLRAMHPIHKCVAKGAPHLFHWRLSPYKVKNRNSDLWASSQIAVSVLTLHGS